MKDSTGALLAAASTEIRGLDAKLTRSMATDSEGRYAFDSLLPGRYSIWAGAPGFEPSVHGRLGSRSPLTTAPTTT